MICCTSDRTRCFRLDDALGRHFLLQEPSAGPAALYGIRVERYLPVPDPNGNDLLHGEVLAGKDNGGISGHGHGRFPFPSSLIWTLDDPPNRSRDASVPVMTLFFKKRFPELGIPDHRHESVIHQPVASLFQLRGIRRPGRRSLHRVFLLERRIPGLHQGHAEDEFLIGDRVQDDLEFRRRLRSRPRSGGGSYADPVERLDEAVPEIRLEGRGRFIGVLRIGAVVIPDARVGGVVRHGGEVEGFPLVRGQVHGFERGIVAGLLDVNFRPPPGTTGQCQETGEQQDGPSEDSSHSVFLLLRNRRRHGRANPAVVIGGDYTTVRSM